MKKLFFTVCFLLVGTIGYSSSADFLKNFKPGMTLKAVGAALAKENKKVNVVKCQ